MNRKLALVALAALVVVVAGWYVALWRPSSSKLRSTRAATVTASARSAQLEGQLAGLVRLEKTLPASEAEARQVEADVPTSASVDTVIDQINAIALEDHITWTSESQTIGSSGGTATPAATGTSGSTPSSDSVLSLSLDIAGTYPNMSEFITNLQHRPRLIVIDTLGYAPQAGDRVSVTLAARAFYNASLLPALPSGLGRS